LAGGFDASHWSTRAANGQEYVTGGCP
jgi:hypothetical protein